MMAGAQSFWENAERYADRVEMPFSKDVMRFIHEAQQASPQ
jgi:hypothetical protein